MTPKISVIIPVYNAEKYLDQCLQSVLNQSFTDFELLLINDGSKDRSGEICEAYATKDSRIQVFHQENKGVSAARNVGLDHAKGEWITFVDSDDYVTEEYYKNLTANINGKADLIIGGFKKVNEKLEEKKEGLKLEKKVISGKNHNDVLKLYPIFNFAYPFAKLFKTEIIRKNKVKFPINIKMYEDSIFILKYINHCNEIILTDSQDYFYVEVKSSLSHGLHSFSSEYNASYLLLKIALDDYGLSIVELKSDFHDLGQRISNSMVRAIISLFRNDYSKKEILKYLNEIDQNCWELYNYYYQPRNIGKKILKQLAVRGHFNMLYFFGRSVYKIVVT